MIDNWFRDEVKRARARIAQLPRWARPVVTRPAWAARAERDPSAGSCTGVGCMFPQEHVDD